MSKAKSSGSKLLAEARILAATKAPYLRAGLMALVPVERPGLGTCAMDAFGRIYYDPNFLSSCDLKTRAFIVLHELVHFQQRHCKRQLPVVHNDPERLAVWRMTVEGPTNEIVQSAFGGWRPDNATTSEQLGLPRNLTVEEAFLRKWKEVCDEKQRQEDERKQAEEEAEKQRQQDEQDEGEGQDGQDTEQDGDATDDATDDQDGDAGNESEDGEGQEEGQETGEDGEGEASGEDDGSPSETDNQEDMTDESQDGQGEGQGEAEGEGSGGQGDSQDGDSPGEGGGDGGGDPQAGGTGGGEPGGDQGVCQDSGEGGDPFGGLDPSEVGGSACDGQQRPWELGPPSEDAPGLSESEQDLIEAVIAKAVEDYEGSHGRGSVHGAMAKRAKELLHPPVDPVKELRACVKYAVESIPGFGEFTFSRPSNRHVPGGCILPSNIRPIPRVTVIVDSSGSMGDKDTALALEVIGSVLKGLPDPRGVRVLTGDTGVQSAANVFRKESVQVVGGGGTSMARIIKQACEERPSPKVIILVTDMETDWPDKEIEPHLLVCATRRSRWCGPPPKWAQVVYLTPEE